MSSKPRTPEDDRHLRAIGGAIRSARTNRKISQEALAHLADIDRSHMGKIERGERNVTAINLLRIAQALDLKPSAILMSADL